VRIIVINKIIYAIKRPRLIIIHILRLKLCRIIPDELFLKIMYRMYVGKKLDLDSPRLYSEKLQWLKLNDRKDEYSTYVDKYEVRLYVAKTIGEDYLVPLLGVYDDVKDIRWECLPDKFVLKCTHGSSTNIVCTDKGKLNLKNSSRKLDRWLRQNWYWYGREWPYKSVKPRIICEQFISNTNEAPEDYKVMCFNGKAKLIQVHLNRFNQNHTCDNYDTDWIKTNISKTKNGLPKSDMDIPRPVFLDEMISKSELIAKNMYHVRVDWYIVKDKLYFGEITFYSACGFSDYDNEEDNYLLGSWIDVNRGGA
jgi:hypothetical protein